MCRLRKEGRGHFHGNGIFPLGLGSDGSEFREAAEGAEGSDRDSTSMVHFRDQTSLATRDGPRGLVRDDEAIPAAQGG